MGIISKMPAALADQIAAGEVVERPASVIKELMENAIDAEATVISVVVQKGGQSLLQVTDNGQGMDRDDLALAFERNATSKIHQASDLSAISTLGFRGEALPSIGSVAQVWARSSTKNGDGSEITIEGGRTSGVKPAPSAGGTTIQVKNLFYNTPARRKFLKKPVTENQYIIEVVRRFALCYPRIEFNLTSNDREVFRLPPTDLNERIGQVFDRHYSSAVKEVSLIKEPFEVTGYVGNLSLVRGRPKEQYIFLNRRAVLDRLLNSGVYAAYRSLISRGEYPFFILNITMPLDMVDVNVHPAKSEVRFRDEWRVYHVVKLAVTEAIRDIPGMMPDFSSPGGGQPNYGSTPFQGSFQGTTQSDLPSALFGKAPRPSLPDAGHHPEPTELTQPQFDVARATERVGLTPSATYAPPERPSEPYNPESIWQVHNKYIVSQVASGMVLIDQHVAHERVLYEEAIKALATKALPSQTVLFPQVIEFAPDEFTKLLTLIPSLERLGFRIREHSDHAVVVDGVPSDVVWGREREIIQDILDRHEIDASGADHHEKIAANYACKAAVKAGDSLTLEEMRTLVDRLFATENPYYCPHGRPTVVHLSMAELDRRFERI